MNQRQFNKKVTKWKKTIRKLEYEEVVAILQAIKGIGKDFFNMKIKKIWENGDSIELDNRLFNQDIFFSYIKERMLNSKNNIDYYHKKKKWILKHEAQARFSLLQHVKYMFDIGEFHYKFKTPDVVILDLDKEEK